MTDEDGRNVTPRAWLTARLRNKVLDWALLGGLGVAATTLVEPLRDRVVAIWNAPVVAAAERSEIRASMRVLTNAIAVVAEDVRQLKQPDAVFEMSLYNTAPIDGYCIETQPCKIRVRLRRFPEFLACDLVPNSVQWGFINPRSDTFVPAQRVDPASGRNVGVVWTDVEITLRTPTGLEPEAFFTFTAFYRGCPGSREEDDPISVSSPRDLFEIRSPEGVSP